MRYLYSILLYLALPFIFLRLLWRSRRQPAYRERWGERLGFYPFKLEKCIWVHTVSMGETIAAAPLIKGLLARYPSIKLLVTTMTPTGSAHVKKLFGDSVAHVYIPYDLPDAAARFIKTMHPVVAIIMETELWPNLIAQCYQQNIPVCVLNARLSAKSAQGYQRVASLTRGMLQQIHVIAAHASADAQRFIALGAPAERVKVTGSIKFDLQLPTDLPAKSAALRDMLGQNRFIWVAASTHGGEEEVLLAAHKALREKHADALLILVPRHPDRFDEIAALSQQSFATVRRSSQQACDKDTGVYLGDTMGEMLVMYGASDVAFVGGSLIPRGGHNLLEPAALGKPVLSGSHLFNFQEISEMLLKANALIKVDDAAALAAQLEQLLRQPETRAQFGARAYQVVEANRGALAAQLSAVEAAMLSVSM